MPLQVINLQAYCVLCSISEEEVTQTAAGHYFVNEVWFLGDPRVPPGPNPVPGEVFGHDRVKS